MADLQLEVPEEPVTLEAARSHLRVDSTTDDALIRDKIAAAREWVENYTGLVLTRRMVTERVSLSSFGRNTRLLAWPVATDQPASISYRDYLGIEQEIAGAVLRAATRPAMVFPAQGTSWPHVRSTSGDADITFTAGFATPDAIPRVLKEAMLVMLTAYYEDREGGDLFAKAEASARGLCRRYKRRIL